MNTTCCKILISLTALFAIANIQAQNLDSLSVIDSRYDSLLRSDGEALNTLFYKHKNDVLINNLGPFGSQFYYPTTFFLYNKNLIEEKNALNEKLIKLSGFRPYSNITYINASRKEQQLSIKHVQELGKLLFLDIDFLKSSSPGAYRNQEANRTFLLGTMRYKSKKGNYDLTFSSKIARDFYQENGGVNNIEDYESGLYDDEISYPVNLYNSNAFNKRYEYGLAQRLDIFKVKSDSIRSNVVYIKHNITYSTQQKVFFDEDPLSSIYSAIYIDSSSTVDSIYNNNLSNTAFLGYKGDNFSVELFGQYDLNEYEQSFGIDTSFNNIYTGIGSSFTKGRLNFDYIFKYGVSGYVQGDLESELFLSYNKEKYNIDCDFTYFLNEPGVKFKNYSSNHFAWNNSSLNKQSVFGVDLNFKLKKMQIDFRVATKVLTNTLYYDSLAMASQDNGSSSISSFSLAKDYRLLNFHFRSALIYQLTSDELLFPLPDITGRQLLYYQKNIFKGAMKLQVGIGLSYSSNYFGYSYMPAINEFTVQGGGAQIGSYPKVDVFVNTHLKRAQIFLKYEHVNSGSNLQNSYIAPGYPSMGKSLKFGVSWNMFD